MRPTAHIALLLFALPAVLPGQAANAPSTTPDQDSSAPTASAAPTPAPRRARVISPEAAAALAATAPRYAPPPPVVEKKPEAELPDLRDVDKPKNTIVRLPRYIVREPRPPVFTERNLNTQQGIKEVAMHRYFTEADRALNRFMLPLFAPMSTEGTANEVRAMTMYRDDERLKNMADMADLANMVQKSDAASGLYIKRDIEKTFIRDDTFGLPSGRSK